MRKTNDGFGLIELLAALAIVALIVFLVMKNYYRKPFVDKETQKAVSEQGIDTTSYGTVKDSLKKQLLNIKDRQQERQGAIE